MRELHGTAVGEDLHVDLARTEESGFASNKRNHAAIRRKRRLAYGVRKPRELNPLGGIRESKRTPQPKGAHSDQRHHQSADPGDSPSVPSVLCLLDDFASVGDRRWPLVRVLLQAAAQ